MDKDLFAYFLFVAIYFTEAINSVHERLNEIERAVQKQVRGAYLSLLT